MKPSRLEQNNCGVAKIPGDALYGATTQNTLEVFSISDHKMPPEFIHILALIKFACAQANFKCGKLSEKKCQLICQAAREVYEGKWDSQFPLDLFQSGSCTPTHMNVNEVIANRVCQLMGQPLGSKYCAHPIDDVNMSQSSNDVVPTAIHICVTIQLRDALIPALKSFQKALEACAQKWKATLKVGRTHLRDAVRLNLGDEFSGYAHLMIRAVQRCSDAMSCLREIPIGGTAVGNGLNAPVTFAQTVCEILSRETGLPLTTSENRFADQSVHDNYMEVAGYLKTIVNCIFKIVNDLRLMGSGPFCGLNEINIQPIHPGSSIMPGKVNPSLCEMMQSVVSYVQAMCQMVFEGVHMGEFELNLNSNLDCYALLEAIRVLSHSLDPFTHHCIETLQPNESVLKQYCQNAFMEITTLVPDLGYDVACDAVNAVLKREKPLNAILNL